MSDDNEETQGYFVINGEDYPFPLLYEGFTMDEAMAFFSYTGFPIEDVVGGDIDELDADERADLEMKARSPKTLSALMHIAYLRKHPATKEAAIRKIVGALDYVTVLSKLGAVEDTADSPPAEPQKSSQQTGSSDERSPETSEPSGETSTTSSDQPADPPAPTGTTESDTSATSVPTLQAV